MSLLCRIGLHGWTKRRAPLNLTRLVRRCARCGAVSVKKRKAGATAN